MSPGPAHARGASFVLGVGAPIVRPAVVWRYGARSGGGRLRRELVLGLEVKIAGVMALMQLTCKIAVGLVHDAPSLHRRTCGDRIGPAQDVFVIVHAEKLGRAVTVGSRQAAIPGPDGHVRNRVVGARDV